MRLRPKSKRLYVIRDLIHLNDLSCYLVDEEAFDELFAALEQAEKKLEQHRFLNGNRLTDSDIRLFVTIVRFDVAYHGYFKCNLKRIEDYPNLRNWVRDLYQVPGISSTVSLRQIKMVCTTPGK